MTYSGRQLRHAMARAAEDVYASGVYEPVVPGEVSLAITEIYDAVGWGAWLRDPRRCPEGYTRPPDPDWCGHLIGYCGLILGDYLERDRCVDVQLRPEIARLVTPSTYRLHAHEKWEQAGVTQPEPVAPEDIERGDIVVTGRGRPYGDHITLALGPPDESGHVDTIEGNAYGGLPSGREGRGVVRRRRHLDEVARVWRLEPEHFEGLEERGIV